MKKINKKNVNMIGVLNVTLKEINLNVLLSIESKSNL